MISSPQRGEGTPQRRIPSLTFGLLLLLCLFSVTVNAEEGSDTELQTECTRPISDYNVRVRVGAIFIVLCTSSIGMDSRGSSFRNF